MDAKITEIVSRMKKQLGPSYVTVQLGDFAELSALIAEQQAESARQMERQTTTLIRLTWAIAILTAVLLFFTVVLYQDAHADIQHRALTEQHSAQQ